MRVEKDFEELLRLFNKYKVKYCVIGAFAVGFYGYPRYTKDIDIFVEPSLANGKKIVAALIEFGFKQYGLLPDDFSQLGKIIQLGYEPVRVDIVTSMKGCGFKRAWEDKKVGAYGKQKVFFIGLTELIKNKQLVNRQQDRIDAERLQVRLAKPKK